MLPLVDARVLRPAETALALKLLTEMDLLRLKAIARLYARGLPADISWEDLLQEALTRILVGSRVLPEGVPTIAVVAGVMRSLRTEHRRGARSRARGRQTVPIESDKARSDVQLHDAAPDPERALTARQELAVIQMLFANDPLALRIIAGLGEGLTAEQIRAAYGIAKTEYDSARKRMRRILLREGLTCERK